MSRPWTFRKSSAFAHRALFTTLLVKIVSWHTKRAYWTAALGNKFQKIGFLTKLFFDFCNFTGFPRICTVRFAEYRQSQLPLKPLFFEVPCQEADPLFVGRDGIVRELESCLGTSLPGVLVSGHQGTGKTALMLQLVDYSCFGRKANKGKLDDSNEWLDGELWNVWRVVVVVSGDDSGESWWYFWVAIIVVSGENSVLQWQ